MSSTIPCAWPSSIWKKHSIVYPDVSCRLFASLALRNGWCVIHWDWPWEDTPHPMTQMAWPYWSQWWLVGWRKSRHDTQPQGHGRPRITCSKLAWTKLPWLAWRAYIYNIYIYIYMKPYYHHNFDSDIYVLYLPLFIWFAHISIKYFHMKSFSLCFYSDILSYVCHWKVVGQYLRV